MERTLTNITFMLLTWKIKRSPQAKKNAFEHVHIVLHKRKVSSVRLLSTETFYSIQLFCLRTTNALITLRGCAGWSGLLLSTMSRRHVFAWRDQNDVQMYYIFPNHSETITLFHDRNQTTINSLDSLTTIKKKDMFLINCIVLFQYNWGDCLSEHTRMSYIVNP